MNTAVVTTGNGFPSFRRKAVERRFVMNNKENQPSQEDTRHPNLAPVSRAHDAADSGISRRGFLGFAAASILLAHRGQQSPRSESKHDIPYRTLGRSQEKVSLIGLGGYHLGN